jgi:hypothetical protein
MHDPVFDIHEDRKVDVEKKFWLNQIAQAEQIRHELERTENDVKRAREQY